MRFARVNDFYSHQHADMSRAVELMIFLVVIPKRTDSDLFGQVSHSPILCTYHIVHAVILRLSLLMQIWQEHSGFQNDAML